MEWWQILIFLFTVYVAYSAGHWVGYGKGEQDTRELTEEIRKLNKKRTRYVRWAKKPQTYQVRNSRQTLDPRPQAKSKSHWWETGTYKTPDKRLPARAYVKSFDKE